MTKKQLPVKEPGPRYPVCRYYVECLVEADNRKWLYWTCSQCPSKTDAELSAKSADTQKSHLETAKPPVSL